MVSDLCEGGVFTVKLGRCQDFQGGQSILLHRRQGFHVSWLLPKNSGSAIGST